MARRAIVISLVLFVTLFGTWSVIAQDTQPGVDADVTAGGSPVASPFASPFASPLASPVGLIGDVERGKNLAIQCLGCHTTDGTVLLGPTWKGLYGRTETLTDGSTVVVDDAYLHESIVDPQAKLVEGFQPIMPAYAFMSEQDIADLIAYIKSLQ